MSDPLNTISKPESSASRTSPAPVPVMVDEPHFPEGELPLSQTLSSEPNATQETGRYPAGVLRFMAAQARFWAPVLLVLVTFELIFWRSGETWPVQRVLATQQAQPNIIWLRRYMDQSFYAYKYAGILQRRPDIVALGSSRVMKFRAPMFGTEADRFYNAGGMIQNLDDLKAFLDTVPADTLPKTVILGVDMWWLNEDWATKEGFTHGIADDGSNNWQSHLSAMRLMASSPKRFATQSLPALVKSEPTRLGLEARDQGRGFRFDGSITNGLKTPTTPAEWKYVDREQPPVLQRIKTGTKRFEPTSGLSEKRMALLKSILLEFKQRGVFVMGFAPAISGEAATLLEKTPEQQAIWREYREQVPALFAELNMPFVDASTTSRLGLDDRYLIDGFHGEEMFHWHLMNRFLKDERVREALPGAVPSVQKALSTPGSNFWYSAVTQ